MRLARVHVLWGTGALASRQSCQFRAIQRSSIPTEAGHEDCDCSFVLAPEPSSAVQSTTLEVSGARAPSSEPAETVSSVGARADFWHTIQLSRSRCSSACWGEATDQSSRCLTPHQFRTA
jgi:hypothetical protein